MSLLNPLGYLLWPQRQWQRVAECEAGHFSRSPLYAIYPLVLALIPAVAWYYGSTQVGWSVAGGQSIKLTALSALKIIPLFYLAMIGALFVIGYMTHWMAGTYGAETSLAKGVSLVSFAATPLFLAGATGFYPNLLFDMSLGLLAMGWALYLLYTGIPMALKLPPERGFLYASAVVGVGLVIFICILVVTVILWDMGAAPQFTD